VLKLAQEQQLHGLLKGEPEVALLDPFKPSSQRIS